jgi:hypothetical protein
VPTIIHGTKDLAIKLSKLNLTPNWKIYIVTCGILSQHSNTKCIDIVSDLYSEYYWNNE